VKNMLPTHLIDHLFTAVRFLIGFILMILSYRAFLKSKATAMLYLTFGFTLITIGDLASAVYYIGDLHMYKIVSQTFDILGLIALVIAVEKVT
jgi:hypothetical protein